MKPVLIGSRALHYWYPSHSLVKEQSDWDVISYGNHDGCEIHDPEFLNNKDMTGYASQSCCVELPDGTDARVMTPIGLAIIKRSHMHRDLFFDKNIFHFFRTPLHEVLKKDMHVNIVKKDLEERTKLTMLAFPQGNPNLMQSKENFFDDAVTKKYDHDFLHELVAFYEKPLYTRLLRTPDLAWCEREKWDKLSDCDKLKCVAEEINVIAIERFLVPREWHYSSKLAYINALKKVCTTLTSGWFRDFALDHYPELIGMYNASIFESVKSKLVKE